MALNGWPFNRSSTVLGKRFLLGGRGSISTLRSMVANGEQRLACFRHLDNVQKHTA